MKQIKVSFFLKILFFIINFVFLFVFLVLQNYFSIFNFSLLIIIIINFSVFFFILKGNIKAVKFAFFLPILTFLYFLFGVFNVIIIYFGFLIKLFYSEVQKGEIYLIFLIIFISLLICYFINLFLLYRKLKKENLDKKYLTNKKQEKTFSILFGITVFLLLIFKFGYYERVQKIEIPENYFETKLENKEIQNEKNMFIGMKKFSESLKIKEFSFHLRENILYCIYEDKCFFEKQDYLEAINFFKGEKSEKDFNNLKLRKKIIYDENDRLYKNLDENYKILQGIDKINIKILLKKNFENIFYIKENDEYFEKYIKFSEKEYFKESLGIERLEIKYSFIQSLNRELANKFTYLFKIKKEKEALKIIEKQMEIYKKIISGDSSLITIMVNNSIVNINLKRIEFILENFNLKDETKKSLKNILEKIKIDENEIIANAIKFDYNNNFSYIKEIFNGNLSKIDNELFDKGEFFYNNFESLFTFDDSVRLEKEKFYNILNKNSKEIKINYLKKNIIGQIFTKENYYNYNSFYDKTKNTRETLEKIIEKIKK